MEGDLLVELGLGEELGRHDVFGCLWLVRQRQPGLRAPRHLAAGGGAIGTPHCRSCQENHGWRATDMQGRVQNTNTKTPAPHGGGHHDRPEPPEVLVPRDAPRVDLREAWRRVSLTPCRTAAFCPCTDSPCRRDWGEGGWQRGRPRGRPGPSQAAARWRIIRAVRPSTAWPL